MDEALINAIMHGNGGSEHKRVFVGLNACEDCIQISIKDQGDGFDINTLFDPTEDEHIHDTHGRGVFLIRRFMSRVTFNEKGNEIVFMLQRSVSSE